MKRGLALLVAFSGSAMLLAPAVAQAQFQSCNFCDVQPFAPDPFDVNACDTGSIIVNGAGFRSRGNNGCVATPAVAVRSTRPDRVTVLSFTVLSDTQIRVDYQVPCSASSGITGIDVTIDDDPSDAISPYACGNARMYVHERTLSVSYASASASAVPGGVEVVWRTLSEEGTLGYAVWTRSASGSERQHPTLIEAVAPGHLYRLEDTRPEASSAVAYRVLEITSSGAEGDGTQWLEVERNVPTAGSRTRGAARAR